MTIRRHTVCRICHAACDLKVEVEASQIKSIIGNKDNPVYDGYSCIKGRESAAAMSSPLRLNHSQKRNSDGTFRNITPESATREIGDKLRDIIKLHGPRSVAIFMGTYASLNGCTESMAKAFARAIGTPLVFDNGTIDQPGKPMSFALHGMWLAGPPAMDQWDALLLVGTNPIISMNGGLGVNPARNLKQLKASGMKLVVIDPQFTESARRADIHLQIRPGTDGVVLAGLLRLILNENRIDADFVAEETHGIDALRNHVEPFTPEKVARHCGIEIDLMLKAADILGKARRGAVSAGTGGNMSGESTLVEYLCRCLSSIRGWWAREGEEIANSGVLADPRPAIAGTMGPTPFVDTEEKMRIRNLTRSAAGLPTAALAEEILMPGEGQIRALIVIGGNPVLAWPDQIRTVEAFESLDLLVTIDPRMSATAEMSHYVLAPKMALECENNSAVLERWWIVGAGWGYDQPYAQVTPPVVQPPEGSDLREDWEFIFDIANAMDLELEVHSHITVDPVRAAELGTRLDMSNKPSATEMWKIALNGSPVDYDEVRQSEQGRLFDRPAMVVQPKPDDWHSRLELGATLAMTLLEELAEECSNPKADAKFPFRLISRRLNDVMNSCGQENPRQKRKWPYNPAFLHPSDLTSLGVQSGDILEITSAHASILGIVEADEKIRPGCVAMTHSWGTHPSITKHPAVEGANTGRLVATDRDFDPVTGLPRMSNIPVYLKPVSESQSAL